MHDINAMIENKTMYYSPVLEDTCIIFFLVHNENENI